MLLADVLKSKEWIDFFPAATEFVDIVENRNPGDQMVFLTLVQSCLIELYRHGRLLPEITLTAEDQYDRDFEIDMNAINIFVGERVPFSYYWVVLNSAAIYESPEYGTGDFIDDICDIYLDLKRSMVAFDLGTIASRERAIWNFKLTYDFHWSTHCIEALNAIHEYLECKKLNGD